MKSSVALIGFMGTGKSSVGKVLAERLGKEFVEIDRLIEERAGKTIPQIFAEVGEAGFRDLESQATKRAARRKNVVIACGGGVILREGNTPALRKGATIVYLKASPSAILKRTSQDATERPLLNTPHPEQRIRELMSFRRPLYEAAADITIDTTRLEVQAVAERIARILSRTCVV